MIIRRINPLRAVEIVARALMAKLVNTRAKRSVKPVAAALAALLVAAAVYTAAEPMSFSQGLARGLRGGDGVPAGKASCVPDSSAVRSGRFTPLARQAVAAIPANATINTATAFLLYRWSHEEGDWRPDWETWQGRLRELDVTSTASDLEAALTVDPETDYTPYVVAARATTVDLSVNGALVASKSQIASMTEQIYRSCREGEAGRRGAQAPGTRTPIATRSQDGGIS